MGEGLSVQEGLIGPDAAEATQHLQDRKQMKSQGWS